MVTIRLARDTELTAVADLTVAAYAADGIPPASAGAYVGELRDTPGRAADADLLVALDDGGGLLGTVTFCVAGSRWAEVAVITEAEEGRRLRVEG